MSLNQKNIAVIGAGVTGMTAADELGSMGAQVSLYEKTPFLGGHAIQLSCKATETCAKCGACLAAEKLRRVSHNSNVTIHIGTEIEGVAAQAPFQIEYRTRLSSKTHAGKQRADAILVATGFSPFNPVDKPYGYGNFQNVITSLDAERMLREDMVIQRPSDGKAARRIAFIQCVGSRDAQLRHLWCSKICCGSSLRMARLIQSRQTEAHIAFFYMDVQNFGKDFQPFYAQVRENLEMIRAIPGDIFKTGQDELEVAYFNPESNKSAEARFDVVVLSVGLTPSAGSRELADTLNWPLETSGFFPSHKDPGSPVPPGIFSAGAARGPMGIAESISSAEETVYAITRYLGGFD